MPAGRGKRNQDRVHTRNAMTKAYGSTDAKCHLPCNDAQLHTSELQAKLQQSQQLQQVEHLQQQPMQQLPLDLAACSHWMASAHCNVACWSNPTTPELFRQSDIGKKRTKDSERRRHRKQDNRTKGGDSTLQWGCSSSSQNGVPIGMSYAVPLNPWVQGDSPTFTLRTAHVPTNDLLAASSAATLPSAAEQQQQLQQQQLQHDGEQQHEQRQRRPAYSNKQKQLRGRRLRDQDDATPAILVVSLHPDLTQGGMLSAPEDLTPQAVWELRYPLLPVWDDEQGVQETLMIAEENSC